MSRNRKRPGNLSVCLLIIIIKFIGIIIMIGMNGDLSLSTSLRLSLRLRLVGVEDVEEEGDVESVFEGGAFLGTLIVAFPIGRSGWRGDAGYRRGDGTRYARDSLWFLLLISLLSIVLPVLLFFSAILARFPLSSRRGL